jgi:hypothetical protein
MARKGRDLFEILRERQSGGRPAAAKPAAARSRPAAGRAPAKGPRGAERPSVGDVGRGLVSWVKKRVGGEAEPPPRPSLSQSGILLAAVAAVALLLGFFVGRATTGRPADASQLRVADPGQGTGSAGTQGIPQAGIPPTGIPPTGIPPTWIRDGDEVTRAGAERAEEILSDFGYFLLAYPALEKQKAADLAVWLRRQGLPTTRIRPTRHKISGEFFFAVITYTDREHAADDLAVLRGLQAPAFAPALQDRLEKLRAESDGPDDLTHHSNS